ncbi:MAG: hypothetical protein CMJ80_02110 [Planctomycetaceae bacterium]|nr:hypothetical protein [Planctomycetaceae bacterium]
MIDRQSRQKNLLTVVNQANMMARTKHAAILFTAQNAKSCPRSNELARRSRHRRRERSSRLITGDVQDTLESLSNASQTFTATGRPRPLHSDDNDKRHRQ